MNNEEVIKTRLVQINKLSRELCKPLRKNRGLEEVRKEKLIDLVNLSLMIRGLGKDLNKFIRKSAYQYSMNYDDESVLIKSLCKEKLNSRLNIETLVEIIEELKSSSVGRGWLLPWDLPLDLLNLLDRDMASDRHRCLIKLSPETVDYFRGEELDLGTGVMNEIQRRLCNYANNLVSRYREINYVRYKTIHEYGFVNLYIVGKNYPTIDREVSDEPRYYVGLGTYRELEKDNFSLLPDVRDVYIKDDLVLEEGFSEN